MVITWAGVDPGATGAIAWITADGYGGVADWPGDDRACAALLAELVAFDLGRGCRVIVEQQQARRTDGRTSVMKLGTNYGIWLGVLAAYGLPVRTVLPAKWKRGYVPPKSKKDASLAVARRMFPEAPLNLKKHDGRAEALLLAHYARETWKR